MPTLYGAPLSPFVRKVAIFLEEKGMSYDWEPVRPHDRNEEFRRISPLGKIPAYQDEQAGLADSSVICFYLEKTYPEPALYPKETLALMRALWFEEYFDSSLIAPMSTIYFQTWFNPLVHKTPADNILLKQATDEQLPPMLTYLESQLEEGCWIAGDRFSIADISLALGFVNMRLIGYEMNLSPYPKLKAYTDRILLRPSFVKTAGIAAAFIVKMKEKLGI